MRILLIFALARTIDQFPWEAPLTDSQNVAENKFLFIIYVKIIKIFLKSNYTTT